MHLVKLVVLGAPGTGKTSLIEQFLHSSFSGLHKSSNMELKDNTYSFSLVINENLYEIKIMDMPMINYFPGNAFFEWTDYRGCALRSAHGYILVFDLTSPGTFHYVKVIRDQLFESRNMQNIPVYVVGTKADLCTSVLSTMRGGHHGHHHHHHHNHLHRHHHDHPHDLTPAFKELGNLVKKQWKCSYLECSAKFNWRIVPIFKDIMKVIESNHLHHEHHRDSLRLTSGSTGSSAILSSGAHRSITNPLRTSNNTHGSTSCAIL